MNGQGECRLKDEEEKKNEKRFQKRERKDTI